MRTEEQLFLERLRWPEVQEALERGFTTVIIPCGAVEQHGPHLPLFVDAEHGTRLGYEVARRLGHALVAPTIRVGCSKHHMGFPGTLSLEVSTFQAVCRDYAVSLAAHGFRKLCFLPSHGGNFQPLADLMDDLADLVGPDCRVVAYTDLMGVLAAWKGAVGDEELAQHVGGHADVAESSVMLHLHPELVRSDLASPGFTPDLSDEAIHRIIDEGFRHVTPNGILGDARGLSAAIGQRCIDALADVLSDHFRQ